MAVQARTVRFVPLHQAPSHPCAGAVPPPLRREGGALRCSYPMATTLDSALAAPAALAPVVVALPQVDSYAYADEYAWRTWRFR